MNFLLNKSLFDNTLFSSDKVLTSAGIQRRYQLGIKERMRKSKEPLEVGRYWLLKKEDTEPFIKCTLFEDIPGKCDSFSGKNESNSTEKSANKSKVNNNKNNPLFSKRNFIPIRILLFCLLIFFLSLATKTLTDSFIPNQTNQ